MSGFPKYRIITYKDYSYAAQYRKGSGSDWINLKGTRQHSWDQAKKAIEDHKRILKESERINTIIDITELEDSTQLELLDA